MVTLAVPTSPDAALLEAFRAGAPRHMATAWRMLGDRQDAAEVVQEAWLRAWRNRSRLRDDAALEAWLRRIVARECLRRLRWRSARGWLTLGLLDEPDAAPSPEQAASASLRRARVRRAAGALPPQQRLCWGLRFEEDWTVAEIAEATGLGPETVKTHLKRASARVRAELNNGL